MKTCKRCGETKPLTAFNAQKKNTDGKMGTCSACRKISRRGKLNGKESFARRFAWRNKIKEERGCCVCQNEFVACALDFHHRDPSTKRFNISAGHSHPMEEILAEIEKCIVICKNCHAKFHAGLFNLPD